MDDQQLDRTLISVGKEVFVTYFKEFCDSSRSNKNVAQQLKNERKCYTDKSFRSRTSHARMIIKAGRAEDALIIISRSKVSNNTKERAVELTRWLARFMGREYELLH